MGSELLINIDKTTLESMLSRESYPEITSIIEKINNAEGSWSHTAHKLRHYRETLERAFRNPSELRIVEFGAGITYFFNYLLLKSIFPRAAIRFLAIEMDFSNEMKHRSYYRGDEIVYLSADAADEKTFRGLPGVDQHSADCVFMDRPVIWGPDDYHGSDQKDETSEMLQALERPGYQQELTRQFADFGKIINRSLPFVLKTNGIILSSALLPGEFPALQQCFSSDTFSTYQKCLVCPLPPNAPHPIDDEAGSPKLRNDYFSN